MKNLILTGFMGAGKTSVGKACAQAFGMCFSDTDQMIETQEGRAISEIFSTQGEEAFRRMETALLKRLINAPRPAPAACPSLADSSGGLVLSVGGGLPVRPENRRLLKQLGQVIWLKVSTETVLNRLKGDTTRPLLQGADVRARVDALLSQRNALYEEAAHAVICVDGKTVGEIVDEIRRLLKKPEPIAIRAAAPDDAGELLEIYAPYVTKTAITFEYEIPALEEFRGRIADTLKKYPYLVAEHEGRLIGYAYTHPFVGRAAYDRAVETSIYVREDQRKTGVGKKLYSALEAVSKAQNILNMNACIGYPETEDPYLTKNSVQFHAHMGYRMVGEFYKCGYKFGTWYNMVWMEKIIGLHTPDPAPVIPFPDLKPDEIANVRL